MPEPTQSPEDILRHVVRACQQHGQVESVAFFCRADRPEQLLCTVTMAAGMDAAARAISPAIVKGSQVHSFVPLSDRFACTGRREGQVRKPMCSDCRWTSAQCRIQLD